MAAARSFITRQTKILCIGHLPGHIDGKVTKLKAAGFPNAEGIITLQTTPEAIKAQLVASPESLFIVGGAMNKEYPFLMAELNAFIAENAPTVIVHNTTAADFTPGCSFPPSEEVVAESGVTIAMRLLKEESH